MTLERAGAVRVRIPFRAPFGTAAGTWRARDAWILRLRDADGREGVGEASLDPAADDAALEHLAVAVRSWMASGRVGDDSPARRAVSAGVEAALVDLGALDLGGGAAAASVEVNATIATEDTAEAIKAARDAVGRGFTALKLKGGREGSTSELVDRLTAVRAAVGPVIVLRLDVNGAWDPATAHERLAGLAPIGLEYVEQPIALGDLGALSRLRATSAISIAADESVESFATAQALLAAAAADVLVVKPGRVGGPLVALAIAREAAAAGVGVTISTLLDTGVGLAAALRVAARLPGGIHGLATADVLESDLLAESLISDGGRIVVPAGPGTPLDTAAIERFVIDRIGDAR